MFANRILKFNVSLLESGMQILRKILLVCFVASMFVSPGLTADKGGSKSPPSQRPNAPSKPVEPKKEPIKQPSQRPNTEPKKDNPNKQPISNNSPSARPNTPQTDVAKDNPNKNPNKSPSANPNVNSPIAKENPNNPNNKSQKFDSQASTEKKKQDSAKAYAAANPKPSYKTPSGETVKINSTDAGVNHVRTLDSNKYSNRTVRVENHYHNYYGPRYDYYRSQPYVYVGGGYSALFWYSMMDWSLERRAMWMYNNQNSINAQLYQQQLADNAQLRAEVEALRIRGTTVNPHYVDPEYKENPDLMYSDEYVHAAYNPQSSSGGWLVLWLTLGMCLTASFIYFWKV